MAENSWYADDDLNDAAAHAARRFDLDDFEARDMVENIAEALEEDLAAVEDVTWQVEDQFPGVAGEDVVEDVATTLGYDRYDQW